jgi:hypothetical protein
MALALLGLYVKAGIQDEFEPPLRPEGLILRGARTFLD